MKKIILFFILIFAFLLNNAEPLSVKDSINQYSYSALNIDYLVRKSFFDKANLVPNFSFEKGKLLQNDSLIKNFELENWQIIGKSIQWTDTDLKFYPNQASIGKHAIRITRDWENMDETEELGEGIQSDFIEVIPGNYVFSYDVFLHNIRSNKKRLGTKIFDAVNVRLLFFDKDKKQIDGKIYYPYFENYLDNSFKGFTFSNFLSINRFSWANVFGRTYNYPFSEGDIPQNCKYVKIFFGLKGSGTMIVDNVNFSYSRWNFTTLERTKQFFDASYSKVALLVPTPQKISPNITEIDINKNIVILTPINTSNAINSAINLLKTKLEALLKREVKITNKNEDETAFVISLGNTDILNQNLSKLPINEIKDKEQAYFVSISEDKNILFIGANDDIGIYYAATTFVQLLDDIKPIYYHSDIVDYPNFTGRSFNIGLFTNKDELQRNIKNIDEMSFYKLNQMYNGYYQWEKKWKTPPTIFTDALKQIGEKCLKTGVVDLALMVHPYHHFDYEMAIKDMHDTLKYYWQHSKKEDMESLKNCIKTGMYAGAKKVMLMTDDFTPHDGEYSKIYSLWTEDDKKKFTNLQNAHAFMINDVYDWLKNNYPKTRLEYCPPYYLNEFVDISSGYAEQYFRDLIAQIPKDVAIVWTGNTVRSLSFDIADIQRFKELIGRYPMLFDNTLYARHLDGQYGGYPAYYPEKTRMCNIFEPYDIYLPKDFYKYNDGAQIFQNGGSYTEYEKIKYITVADYEWNNNNYDADFSLYKALIKNFSKENAIKLLEFSDKYFSFIEMYSKLKNPKEYKETENYKQNAEKYILQMNKILSVFGKKFSNQMLLKELKELKDKQEKKYRDFLKENKDKKEGLRQL